MEEKINIAKILKDKPVNTKLYSPLYGDVYFSYIGVRNNICVLHHRFTLSDFFYNGRYTAYKESEIMLFPSKEMRDWRKFWKKGDVLVNKDNNSHIIFDKFNDDTYTTFIGKLYYETTKHGYNYTHTCSLVKTQDFDTKKSDIAQTYINTIEKILGGKLNMETLEIEKTYPEFKPLDYVLCKSTACYDMKAYNLFQYAYKNKEGAHIMVGGAAFMECIPYIGNEELLGKEERYGGLGMNDESIDVNISFINTDYFSVSVRDGSISVIGRITKLEMEKFVKAQYFKIKEVLDKNSKEGGNHD